MTTFDDGMQNRKSVLTPEHVERSLTNAHPLSRPLQELVTEYCWGAVWGRPALDRRTRSLITVAMLTAGGHHDELRLHAKAAIRNGCTKEEVAEVITHSAIYCGVPAALSAMRAVTAALDELPDTADPTTDPATGDPETAAAGGARMRPAGRE